MTSVLNMVSRWERSENTIPYGALFLRMTLAVYWIIHCFYKVFYQGMDKTEMLFSKLGYPTWMAWGDIALELAAIVSFILGLYVRSFSILVLFILIPAMEIWLPHGFWGLNGGYEFPVLWCLLQIVLALLGPGPYSIKTLKL